MQKPSCFTHLALAVFAGASLLLANPLVAQTTTADTASSAAIDIGSGTVLRPWQQKNRFARVGLKPHQIVTITLQFPSATSGQIFAAEALDGGNVIVIGQSLATDQDGVLTFKFQAGDSVGHYRVVVHQGESAQTLQFWVRDLNNPQNDPPLFPGS